VVCGGSTSIKRGTSEHPEELTDRCCLSALAGLSKYLPSLGACVIIGGTLCYVNVYMPCDYDEIPRFSFQNCFEVRMTVGIVGAVDSWKVRGSTDMKRI